MFSADAWSAVLTWTWVPTILLALIVTLLFSGTFGGRPKNFPPGMIILPVVGSLLSMPFGPSMEVLQELKKKYGNLASFAIFGTRMVMVSSVSLMKEVFALKTTVARPEVMINTTRNILMTDKSASKIGIIGTSGELWQEQRRFLLHHLRDLGFGKSSYEPVMVEEIAELMHHLKKQEGRPVELKRNFYRSVINILWGMFMGKRFPYNHEKLNKLLDGFIQLDEINLFSPVSHIPYISKISVFLPVVKNKLKPHIKVCFFLKEEIDELLASDDLKNKNSFTSLYLQEIKKGDNPNFNMDQLRGIIFDMFLAGMETTSSTLTVGINLMIKHPDVQRRVQQELDEVVGRDRLPSFSDIERLPYVKATIHEIQRRFNMVKFSLPHETSEDCKIGGYDIPKGTWLLANLNDAHTNREYWKSFHTFDPENFLDENGKYKKNDAFLPFGVGKRLCAGEPLARMELFLFITHLLHKFTFSLAEEYKPLNELNPSFNCPPDYTVYVKCRP